MKLFNNEVYFKSGRWTKMGVQRLGKEFEGVEFKQEYSGYTAPLTYRNAVRANRKEFYPVLSNEKNYPSRIVPSLWDHQQEIKNFQLNQKQCIIASQQRTGKTLPTCDTIIEYLENIIKAPDRLINEIVYWIAPKSGIKSVKDELDKWFPHDSLTGQQVFETLYQCKLELKTYESWRLHWIQHVKLETVSDWANFQTYCNKPENRIRIPRICIFDEVHKIKSHKGKQGKMARMMRIAQEAIYGEEFLLLGLSGTPSPKQPSDWWNIMEMVVPGFLKESSPEVLTDRLAEVIMRVDEASGMAFPKIDHWLEKECEEFALEIRPKVLTLWKSEVLDLPEKDHQFIKLEQNKETKQAIRFLKATAENAARLRQSLRQISDGFLYDSDYDAEKNLMVRSTTPIHTPKIDQLREDLSTYENGEFEWQDGAPVHPRVMITGGYKGTIEVIREECLRLGWNVLQMTGEGWRTFTTTGHKGSKKEAEAWLPQFDRSKPMEKMIKDKLLILGHPKSMATGLELSMCSLMIAFSHTDDGESEMQVLDRPHSNNMDKELGFHIRHYIHVMYDLLISKSLRDKSKFQSITMSDIRTSLDQDLWEIE